KPRKRRDAPRSPPGSPPSQPPPPPPPTGASSTLGTSRASGSSQLPHQGLLRVHPRLQPQLNNLWLGPHLTLDMS
ncbi:hypothetical protein Tco_0634418, partial [Tanacetum coccineum]